MREIVREEADRGAAVFFSSHILEQVEAVCDRVGILHDGELVTQDTVEGLREASGTEAVLSIEVDQVPEGVLDAVRGLSGVSEASATETTVTVKCHDNSKATVLNELEAAGASIRDFDIEETSLEELFMAYTSDEEATEVETRTGELSESTAESEEIRQ